MFIFYITALIVTFLGIVINLPGSIHVNPILLNFYSAKEALFLSTIYLVLGAAARVIIFRKDIITKNIYTIITLSVLGGILGGYFLHIIPEYLVVLIFLFSGIRYLIECITKKYRDKKKLSESNSTKYDLFNAGFFVSFLQAFGISGGPLRQSFYMKQGYTLIQIQGTSAVIFLLSGTSTLFSRALFENTDTKLLLLVLPLFPLILVVAYLGKRVLFKIPKNVQEQIIIYTLIISLTSVLPKLF